MFYAILIFLQILIEPLPISSSGHLQLFISLWQKFKHSSIILEKGFEYLMHGPTLLVLTIFFRSRWLFLLKNIKKCRYIIINIFLFGFCAELSTIVPYIILEHSSFKNYFEKFPLWFGFMITGLLLFSTHYSNNTYKKFGHKITFLKALLIGLTQGISLLPGVSRSGSTYAIGCWLGLSPRISFFFSWMITFPIMFAGFSKGLIDYLFTTKISSSHTFIYISISIIAGIISYYLFYFIQKIILRNSLWYLSFYMIFPMILALLL